MAIDYECLGRNDKIRKRRYDILQYHTRGIAPDAISKMLNLNRKAVYNDIVALNEILQVSIPLQIIKGTQYAALELKIRELEIRANRPGTSDTTYNQLQNSITKNRELLLKLMGLMSDKVELAGEVKTVLEVRYEDPPKNE